jgi:uridine kinase
VINKLEFIQPFVIGVGGGSGSGKTCVSNLIRHRYKDTGVAILNQDSYYIDRSAVREDQRPSLNYDHPSAFDHDLLLRHVEQLINGSVVERPCYCFIAHTRRVETELINPAPVILVEGIFALWDPRLRSRMNFRIYVDADSDLRLIRRLRRDVLERGRTMESVVEQYLASVRPMYEAFVKPTQVNADLVVVNSGSLEDLATLLDGIAADSFRNDGQTSRTRTTRQMLGSVLPVS